MKTKIYNVSFSTMENVPTAYCLPSDVEKLEGEINEMKKALEEIVDNLGSYIGNDEAIIAVRIARKALNKVTR